VVAGIIEVSKKNDQSSKSFESSFERNKCCKRNAVKVKSKSLGMNDDLVVVMGER